MEKSFAVALQQGNWVPKEMVEGGTNRHNGDEAETQQAFHKLVHKLVHKNKFRSLEIENLLTILPRAKL